MKRAFQIAWLCVLPAGAAAQDLDALLGDDDPAAEEPAAATTSPAPAALQSARLAQDSVHAQVRGVCLQEPGTFPFRRVTINATEVTVTLTGMVKDMETVHGGMETLDFSGNPAAQRAFGVELQAAMSSAKAYLVLTEAVAIAESGPQDSTSDKARAKLNAVTRATCGAGASDTCVEAKHALHSEYCDGVDGLVSLSL